jgi:hypothetical protein
MPYSWNDLRFDLPAGLVDQTVVTFVDDAATPSFQVTVTVDGRGSQAFEAYVEAQLADLARAVPGYSSTARTEDKTGAGRPAIVVEHTARSPEGQAMRQRQAYVDLAGERVAIVTVTHADKDTPRAKVAFASILSSLS